MSLPTEAGPAVPQQPPARPADADAPPTDATPPDAPPGPPAPPADATAVEAAPSAAGPRAGVVAGAVLVVAGIALFARALVVGADRGVTLGGPTTAPIVVTGLWVAVALVYLAGRIRAARVAGRTERAADRGEVRWRVPLLLLVALVAYAVVLKYTLVGYVLATIAFYLAAAFLLSTRPWRETVVRDVAVAVGLALAVYLTFTKLLGIVLPAGVLPL